MQDMISGIDIESLLPGRRGRSDDESTSERSWQEEVEENVCSFFPALTPKERITGCLACIAVGYILSLGSWMRFGSLLRGNAFPFVLCSTMGNIVALSGSCFLSGPQSQAKKMFQPVRRIASILYLSSMVITFMVAFTCSRYRWQPPLLVLLVLVQYACIAWYCMSYIPFARQWMKQRCSRWITDLMEE